MTADNQSIFCATCGRTIDEDPSRPIEERKPCPSCGSMARNIHAIIHETVTIREKLGLKGRHPGGKKPFIEEVSGDDLHRKSGKWMKHSRVIDRDNDSYHEVVIDPDSGKIVHECKEPLSQHRGHGSDKHKRTEMNNRTDVTVLILRFFFGVILGVIFAILLFVPLVYILDIIISAKTILLIVGMITLTAGITAIRWGDRFLLWVMNVFKIFKYW